jgi:Uncharacterized protein conserved in bacteria
MEKIIPHLWYDQEAVEAAKLYTSILPSSKINNITTLDNTPSGDCDIVSFELCGQPFMSISAGPIFKFTPAVSFLIACDSVEEVDKYWKELGTGGKVLMELGEYPFSKRYGWIEDKYGLSWQVILSDNYAYKQKITATWLFAGEVAGKAEEAMQFYASVFPDSKMGDINRYPAGMEPDKEGTVMHGSVFLAGQEFYAMDSARQHEWRFTEALSFQVFCKDQQEIDYYWERLSAVPEAEQCGWLKDKFGFSWQIVPERMEEMMSHNDKEKVARVTQAFLKMKKFDLAELERAYEGVPA